MVTAAIGMGRANAPHPRMILVFRPAAIDTPPAWLVPGGSVTIMVGHGEHLGSIRLVPGRDYTLGRTGGRNHSGAAMLFFSLPPAFVKEERKSCAVDMDWSDTWVDVTLPPEWWMAPAPKPAVAAPPKPFALAAGVSSHPGWNSPRAQAAHEAAVKGNGR
jgi:hypothetical protein